VADREHTGGVEGAGVEGLERWAADARAREAADARVRERWLRTQAEEDARLAQVLAGLAERRAAAVATTTAGHQVSGRVSAVGQDFLALAGQAGRTTLIPLAALAWIRQAGGAPGRRRALSLGQGADDAVVGQALAGGASASLVDVLSHAAGQRPRTLVHAGAVALAGELRAVGVDVLVLETSGEPAGLAYVPLQSLSDISLLTSG
jgi:hypothetical protein